jgi:hypothetical protein
MNMKDIDKLEIHLTPGVGTALIKARKGAVADCFQASASSLSALFADRYCSGYLPVSQDGVVYLEDRNKKKLVVVQRGERKNTSIRWRQKVLKVNTPTVMGMWLLTPHGGGWKRENEIIFTTTGPARGPLTPLYGPRWMGNTYAPDRRRGTNICWGSTAVAPGGVVTVSSLMNLLGDFFTHPFTSHLGGSEEAWNTFTQKGRFPQNGKRVLSEQIRRMWEYAERY